MLRTTLNWLTRIFILLIVLDIGYRVYDTLIHALFHGSIYLRAGPFLLLWLLTAYVVIPRIHRWLTRLYLPDYYIGRVRTGDGLLGDPVNLAVDGTKAELVKAMKDDGWRLADPLTFRSSLRMVKATLLHQSYETAPVSSLYLFGGMQDFAFQKEVNGNTHARHHVRFWKSPTGWWLPGGNKVDWLGAATYDRRIGLSLFTGQITHKIAENTDDERDMVASTLARKGRVTRLEHFSTAYTSRNGGGDNIKTDGSFVIANIRQSEVKK